MFIFMALLLLYSFLQSFNDCKDLFEDFFFGSMVSYDGVGGVPVEGDSFLIEVVDFLGAVFEERAFFYFYVAGNIFGVAVKEEDVAIFLEVFYAGTSFDDAASGGYDEVFLFGKVTDGSFFGIAEGVFGNGEEGGDGSSFFFFEVIVGIDEGAAESFGDGFAEGGLAASGHADQDDVPHRPAFFSFALSASTRSSWSCFISSTISMATNSGMSWPSHISSARTACMTSM